MVQAKNPLNLNSNNKNKNTLQKSIYSRRQVDSIIKRENISIQDVEVKVDADIHTDTSIDVDIKNKKYDDDKRLFLKVAGVAGLGLAASALFPKGADAYVAGSTPTSNVVGLKNSSNTRINPATEETVGSLISGQNVSKLTTSLSSSGIVQTPTSGKRIRVYASRFSLTADATSVSFRFTSGGTDHEKYLSPKTGGLYGANNHPNYIEGGVNEALYCNIAGTTTVQINIDYLEV